MRIEINLDDLHPPTGEVVCEAGSPQVFVGWLGLLGVLSGLLDRPSAATAEPPPVP